MKTKWYKRKLTFIVLQEANRSVVQFKLMKPLIVIVPLIVALISSALVILYMIHKDSVEQSQHVIASLSAQLSDTENEYAQAVAANHRTIEALQSDIISLSQQAESIKTKVEALKKLENELRDVTEPIVGGDVVTISSFEVFTESPEISSQSAIGGIHIPVRNDEISDLAIDIESDFYYLSSEMDLLLSSLSLAKEQIIEYQELMRVTPTIWPTKSQRVTSNFGYRNDPFTRRPSFHSGIDIGGNRNDPVYATADGVVHSVGRDRNLGNYVIIKHENGIKTHYYHLQKTSVSKNQEVVKGEEIGLLGSTGRSTGPHLHYEVEKDNVKVDPKPYMQDTRKD